MDDTSHYDEYWQLASRNLNALWAACLVDTLNALGLDQVVVSPGSRSGPIATAFNAHPAVEASVVLDERSAAFVALGMARQSRRPVALLCTSGTAGAHYYPAVIEARMTGVPLIILTADRPPELRNCHAGQAIDQQKLYGDYVVHYAELALPESDMSLFRYLRQTMRHAWSRSISPWRGPVHLNVPLRDPLAPVEETMSIDVQAVRELTEVLPPYSAQHFGVASSLDNFLQDAETVGNGLIVVGPCLPDDAEEFCEAIAELSQRLQWVVVDGGLSPLRGYAEKLPLLVSSYDCILRNEKFATKLKPDAVLSIGALPTSKMLRQWLSNNDCSTYLCHTIPDNPDGVHRNAEPLAMDVAVLTEQVAFTRDEADPVIQIWLDADRRCRSAFIDALDTEEVLFEGAVAKALFEKWFPEAPVVVASSMPVRDVEFFRMPNDRKHPVIANRGANGIDGTLSTALGVAHASDLPVLALVGDLAFLHDTNALLSANAMAGSLTIVVINNYGGGIFEHLPIAEYDPPFEACFATPQDADIGLLCQAHGVWHSEVHTLKTLEKLLTEDPQSGVRVIEIPTDRKRDAAFRKELFARIAKDI